MEAREGVLRIKFPSNLKEEYIVVKTMGKMAWAREHAQRRKSFEPLAGPQGFQH